MKITERSKSDPDRILVSVEGTPAKERLTLRWAGEGWPADVKEVLADTPDPWPRELVVVGRHFSPGALRALRERDANWVDETGDANIVGPSRLFVIRLEGRPRRGVQATEASGFTWTASALAIAETILATPKEPILNRAIASATGFSAPQISRTLAQFDKRGWTRKTGAERGPGSMRVLADGDGLLRSWAAYVAESPRSAIQAHAIFKEPFEFLRQRLSVPLKAIGEWGLSGWAGLELMAPFATQVTTLHLYLPRRAFDDRRIEDFLNRGRLRRVDEGGRVILWPADETPLRLTRKSPRRQLPVVSAPRLYADLLSFGGRGVDAAEHVRETLIEL